jgi:hypothetical protein
LSHELIDKLLYQLKNAWRPKTGLDPRFESGVWERIYSRESLRDSVLQVFLRPPGDGCGYGGYAGYRPRHCPNFCEPEHAEDQQFRCVFLRLSMATIHGARTNPVSRSLCWLQFAGLMILVAVVAATTSYITAHSLSARSELDIHQQIHRQLGLSEEQERLLKPLEARFKARRQELRAALDQANLELA